MSGLKVFDQNLCMIMLRRLIGTENTLPTDRIADALNKMLVIFWSAISG